MADVPPVTPRGLALGEPGETDAPLGALGELEITPVSVPGEPGLPLMRPLAFGRLFLSSRS